MRAGIVHLSSFRIHLLIARLNLRAFEVLLSRVQSYMQFFNTVNINKLSEC